MPAPQNTTIAQITARHRIMNCSSLKRQSRMLERSEIAGLPTNLHSIAWSKTLGSAGAYLGIQGKVVNANDIPPYLANENRFQNLALFPLSACLGTCAVYPCMDAIGQFYPFRPKSDRQA
jgi:hypothetical protein